MVLGQRAFARGRSARQSTIAWYNAGVAYVLVGLIAAGIAATIALLVIRARR
jgi:hypothetical protein